MNKLSFILLTTTLITSTAYAGGSLFKNKHKTANTNGVYSIGVHICSSLECPPVRIVSGKCDGPNMEKRWGVCVCESGYVAKGGGCVACPEGQYSDGIHGCKTCPEGTYRAHDNDTECTECPTYTDCTDDECCSLTGPTDICGNQTPVFWGFKDNTSGACRDCSEYEGITSTANECAKCDKTANQRIMFGDYCIPKLECSEGQFQGGDSEGTSCYNCSETAIYASNADECAKCDKTDTPRVIYAYYFGIPYCVLKCPDGQFHEDPFPGVSDCIPCSKNSYVSAIAEECARCDKTDYPRMMRDNYCIRKLECPDGQFQGDINCYDCSETMSYVSLADECAKCDPYTPRKMFGDICGLKDCGNGMFRNIYHNCYDCSMDGNYSVFGGGAIKEIRATVEECNKCPNRFMISYTDDMDTCMSCLNPRTWKTSAEECAKCGSQRTYNSETGKCSKV